jgi:hypothetical protein
MLCVAFITMLFAAFYTPLGVILVLVFDFGVCAFMAMYVAYPQMKKFMIDPYYSDNGESTDGEDEEDDFPRGGKPGGYGEDDGEYYDGGEYVTDEDEYKSKKK